MSRMARTLQRQQAHAETENGWVTDPMRLPFMRILEGVQYVRFLDAFRIMVTCAACALTVGKQEELYLQTIAGLKRSDLEIIVRAWGQLQLDMEDRPYRDLLGPAYMAVAHKLDRDSGGEFFTPYALSRFMAEMKLGKDPREAFTPGKILMCGEPACGSGGMILAFTEVLVERGVSPLYTSWEARDISNLSCYAAFVNTTLWGIPARIICGNTLSNEVRWQWDNLFWHQARPFPEQPSAATESRMARMVEMFREMLTGETPTAKPALEPQEAAPKAAAPFGAEFGPLFGGEW